MSDPNKYEPRFKIKAEILTLGKEHKIIVVVNDGNLDDTTLVEGFLKNLDNLTRLLTKIMRMAENSSNDLKDMSLNLEQSSKANNEIKTLTEDFIKGNRLI